MRLFSIIFFSASILVSSSSFSAAKVSPKIKPQPPYKTEFVTEHTTKKVSANPIKFAKEFLAALKFYSKKKNDEKSSRRRHRN